MTEEIEKLSFEEALRELEALVRKIDNGQETLESTISAFERGTKLKAHCEHKLKEAKLKIEKIVPSPDGSTTMDELEQLS